jgi:DNA-binding GntR family transcriptional regulator
MRPKSNQAEGAYTALRERIISGELLPGAVVSEASLAKELGVSRTPVGEALRRLSHEGFVHQIPRYGTVVREISATDLRELFEIREALEGMAASKAAASISAEALDELESLCAANEAELEGVKESGSDVVEGESLRRFLAADMAFHMLIIASANNRRLSELLEQTRSISVMFNARRGVHSVARVEEANAYHRQILTALASRDSSGATEAVIRHIRVSCEQSLRAHQPPGAPARLGTLNLPDFIRRDLKAAGN